MGLPDDPSHKWTTRPANDLEAVTTGMRDRWYGQYGVAGELLRIAYDSFDGVPVCHPLPLRQALLAGVVAEMLLVGQVTCANAPGVPCAVAVVDGVEIEDPAGRLVAENVAEAGSRHSVQDWMTRDGLCTAVHDTVAERFVTTRMMRWTRRPDRRGVMRPVLVATDTNRGASTNAMNRLQRAVEAGPAGRRPRQEPSRRPSPFPANDPASIKRRLIEAMNTRPAAGWTDADVACAALLVALDLSEHIRRESARTRTRLHKAVPPLLTQLPAQLRLLLAHADAAIRQTTTRVQQ
ncbi:GPP34 family phosphoprotein [Actinocatenispora comari]|nr:GPP34 family phosphoprotein [Actinocatenispora comari]